MNKPLRNLFETQLKAVSGTAFQDAVAEIFRYRYGETGFTSLRNTSDKGCDGIIESDKRIIACYGPQENRNTKKRVREFKSKAEGDYKKYQNNWQQNYPNWSIVINHQIDPKYDEIVKKLHSNATVIGLEQLIWIIENLKKYHQRKLGEHFRIDLDYFSSDYLSGFLDDLLSSSQSEAENISYDKRLLLDIERKIAANYDTNDIDGAVKEFEHLTETGAIKQVDELMSTYDDNEINSMKNKLLYDFNNQTNGTFKVRLKQLTERYLSKYSPDDDEYLYHIRAVLIHLFEQCLIGKKN